MLALLGLLLTLLTLPFRSKSGLAAENAALRHQVAVLQRKVRGRIHLTNADRLFFVQLYRWFPLILKAITVIRPETIVRWHRAGFRCYWRWKSRSCGGRPPVDADLRALIRRMSVDNPLWGAPRIHGELFKLGFDVAQSSVAKYMVKQGGPPSQGWLTFLRNQAPNIAAMDLFVVPTVGFDLLYVLVITVWNAATFWTSLQIQRRSGLLTRSRRRFLGPTPRYLIRDQDRVYGAAVMCRLRAIGIRDKPVAPASPWQNGYAERLIGSIRRECTDHVLAFGAEHLRRILQSYARYYNMVEDASITGQGRSHSSGDRALWRRRGAARTRWTSPPILPNLVFGTHRMQAPSMIGRQTQNKASLFLASLPTKSPAFLLLTGAPGRLRVEGTANLRQRFAGSPMPSLSARPPIS